MISRLFNQDSGIVLACDVITLEKLVTLVRIGEANPAVAGYKIGFALGLTYSLRRVVDTIRKYSKLPIIYDHQKAGTDIPRMGTLFAKTCRSAGVDGIIVFPLAGPKTLLGFVDAIVEVDATPIVGGVMTHPAFLKGEGGFIDDAAPQTIYNIAAQHRVNHFVLPGNRPDLIHKYASVISAIRGRANLLMPGIGTQGGQVTEAFSAAGDHRCYAIIGSSIYDAENKEKALADVAKQLPQSNAKP